MAILVKRGFIELFRRYPTGTNATVIASYDDGSPALFEKPYGNLGRVLCFTSTIDREWNDLPIRAVYLPFLHESIKYLALKDAETLPDYRVGDYVELKVSDVENEVMTESTEVAIFNPNNVETRLGRNTDVALAAEETLQSGVLYTDTTIPGIYSVHRSGAEVPAYFVVNVDTTESDLSARDIEELGSMLKGTADEFVEDKPTAELVAQYNEGVERNQNVWIYLMFAVFALAITEMFLANRF